MKNVNRKIKSLSTIYAYKTPSTGKWSETLGKNGCWDDAVQACHTELLLIGCERTTTWLACSLLASLNASHDGRKLEAKEEQQQLLQLDNEIFSNANFILFWYGKISDCLTRRSSRKIITTWIHQGLFLIKSLILQVSNPADQGKCMDFRFTRNQSYYRTTDSEELIAKSDKLEQVLTLAASFLNTPKIVLVTRADWAQPRESIQTLHYYYQRKTNFDDGSWRTSLCDESLILIECSFVSFS